IRALTSSANAAARSDLPVPRAGRRSHPLHNRPPQLLASTPSTSAPSPDSKEHQPTKRDLNPTIQWEEATAYDLCFVCATRSLREYCMLARLERRQLLRRFLQL